MELLAQLAAVVAPVFLCAGLGLGWAKRGLPFRSDVVTGLVYNVGAPCLILATFAKVELDPDALASIFGAAIVCLVAFAVIGFAVLRLMRLAIPSYLPALIFPLTGSMGLPVCLFAYGDEGLALGLVYFAIGAVGTFTIGAAVASGRMSLGSLARTPAIYAVVIAVGMEVGGVALPDWLFNTMNLLAGIVIPTQLIALGVSLANLRAPSIVRSAGLSSLRLGMGAVVGWGVAEAFGLTGTAWAIVIIQSAMPVAVSSYLFAQLYKREPEEVAGMVLISTVLALFALPLLLILIWDRVPPP